MKRSCDSNRGRRLRAYVIVLAISAIFGCLTGVRTASAGEQTITAGMPNLGGAGGQNGFLNLQWTDTSALSPVNVPLRITVVPGDTAITKATKILMAINGYLSSKAGAAAAGQYTVTQNGAAINISRPWRPFTTWGFTVISDSSNENTGIAMGAVPTDGGAQYATVEWVTPPDPTVVPPSGLNFDLLGQTGSNSEDFFSAGVTSDGVMNVGQLENSLLSQLASDGMDFTPITDPTTGLPALESQPFLENPPASGENEVGMTSFTPFSDWLGTFGTSLTAVPEPSTGMLLGTAAIAGAIFWLPIRRARRSRP